MPPIEYTCEDCHRTITSWSPNLAAIKLCVACSWLRDNINDPAERDAIREWLNRPTENRSTSASKAP